jgi:cytochrome b561
MRRRGGGSGYGAVAKLLHWLTVLAVAAQFAIGLSMDPGAAADRADERVDAFEARGEQRAEDQGGDAEERFDAEVERRRDAVDALEDSVGSRELGDVVTGRAWREGLTGVELHVAVGLGVLLLGLVRLLWRRMTPLPPWADHLSAGERTFQARLEKVLLGLLIVVPGTGLLLALGGDDLLPLHVAAQVALVIAVVLHVGLVLKHTVVRRNRHLARML